MLIGDADNAVVFDFSPTVDAGAEMLGRRGEDQRLEESRPAAERRRAIDAAMPDARRERDPRRRRPPARRADARRADVQRDDPDWGWTEDDPGRRAERRVTVREQVAAARGSWSRSARPR